MWSFFSRDSSKDFPYEIGEMVQENKSIWNLHKATKKGEKSEEVSVFVYDIKNGTDIKFELAKAAMKRIKTLRHPSILQYLDSLETEKNLYIATELIEPLGSHMSKISTEKPQRDLYISWGIFQITVNNYTFSHSNIVI